MCLRDRWRQGEQTWVERMERMERMEWVERMALVEGAEQQRGAGNRAWVNAERGQE